MKKLFLLTSVLSLFFAMTSCEGGVKTTNTDPDNVGKLRLSFSTDETFDVKSTTSDEYDYSVDDFEVTIYSASGDIYQQWDKASDIDEIIGLETGSYTIEVTSGEMEACAWNKPHFYGEDSFYIEPDNITAVDVECFIDNAKISIEYTDAFKTYFATDPFKIYVSNEDSEDGAFYFESTTTQSLFVKPMRTVLVLNSEIAPSTMKIIDPLNAREHYIVTYDVSPVGSATISISVDVSTVDKDLTFEVPTDTEDLGNGGNMPDVGEPDTDPSDPDENQYVLKVEGSGFNIDETLYLSASEDIDGDVCKVPVIIQMTAEAGIESLVVTIDIPQMGDDFLTAAIGATTFDLANLSDEIRANLIQFTLLKEDDVIKGATYFEFDVTNFMPLLVGDLVNTNTFSFVLTDAKGNSISKAVSIAFVE